MSAASLVGNELDRVRNQTLIAPRFASAVEIWTRAKNRRDGVTRTEVRDLFSRNKEAREIDRALTRSG